MLKYKFAIINSTENLIMRIGTPPFCGVLAAVEKRFQGVTGLFLALCWRRNVKNKLRLREICWYHDRITMVNTVNYNGKYIIPHTFRHRSLILALLLRPMLKISLTSQKFLPWLRSGIKRTNGGCNDLYNFMLRRFYDHEFIFQHILEKIRIIYPV